MIKLKILVLIFNPIFASATAITCHTSFSSVEAFVDCLDKHTVPEGFYTTEGEYNAAQPSGPSEINAWTYAVNSMLSTGCPSGPATAIPGLTDYVMARVTDSSRFGKTWCVLVEANTVSNTSLVYKRGWGFVITPYQPVSPATRRLHFSAPHPQTDGNTPQQAAALFARTGAKSLVVTGRHRRAYATGTSCSVAIPPDTYYKTDSSHDNNEPFYLAVSEIASWQDQRPGGCQWASCAYLQMHGKSDDPADPTCPEYDVFMSSGLGNSDTSEACYSNVLLPITRLKAKLVTTFPEFDIGTPTNHGPCNLTATRNVFMRRVSGIDATDVCVTGHETRRVIPCACTATRGCMGKFVHIEQDSNSRHSDNYGKWADAIKAVFPESTPLRSTEELEASIFKVQS